MAPQAARQQSVVLGFEVMESKDSTDGRKKGTGYIFTDKRAD
jgi:hypothetical protein